MFPTSISPFEASDYKHFLLADAFPHDSGQMKVCPSERFH